MLLILCLLTCVTTLSVKTLIAGKATSPATSGEINVVCWIAEMFTMTSHKLECVILMMISLEVRPTCCHATLDIE
jgi:hypothetical protein